MRYIKSVMLALCALASFSGVSAQSEGYWRTGVTCYACTDNIQYFTGYGQSPIKLVSLINALDQAEAKARREGCSQLALERCNVKQKFIKNLQ